MDSFKNDSDFQKGKQELIEKKELLLQMLLEVHQELHQFKDDALAFATKSQNTPFGQEAVEFTMPLFEEMYLTQGLIKNSNQTENKRS